MLVVSALFGLLITGASTGQASTEEIHTIVSELHSRKYAEALAVLRGALATSPRDPRLWTLNGFALLHLGQNKEALTSYERALEISPDYVPALEGDAEIRFSASDRKAIPLLKKIVSVDPKNETAHAMLGSLAFLRGDCVIAASEFGQSSALIASQPDALKQQAYCLVKLKRESEALAAFERLSELEPNNHAITYNVALLESMEGNYQETIKRLEPLVRSGPPEPEILDVLAEAYEATSSTPQAVAALREAIVLAPDEPSYYVDFADICLAHSSYQVGVDMLTSGLRRLPRSAPLYLARGILYVQLGEYDKGEQDFGQAEQLAPNAQASPEVQGLAELQRNNLPQAEVTVRSRLQKQPNNAFLHYLLAEILVRKGAAAGSPAFTEAVNSAERAVALQPNLALARDLLGRLYLSEGKLNQAIIQSQLAYSQDPDDQTALYHLIVALRKGHRDSEIPALSKKLTQLREHLRAKEAAQRKYTLVEVAPPQKPAIEIQEPSK